MSLAHFDLDPRYGGGTYRRRVTLRGRPNAIVATVLDTHHSMWLLLNHKGGAVASVEAAIERGPATTCGDAGAELASVIGTRLDASPAELSAKLPPAGQCTHLADLLRWALRAAHRGPRPDVYEITVPDQGCGPVWIQIERNGAIVHRWLVDGETIVAPAELAGRPLLRGFRAWARAQFNEDDLEAAIMLQRGAWVARGRRYVVDRAIVPLRAARAMQNACFSYSGANWTTATNNLGYVRDFSGGLPPTTMPGRVLELLGEDHHATE